MVRSEAELVRAVRPVRILLAKVGLDGHDRGVKVLAALLREYGFEVIYLGLYNTPEAVAQAALEEDVDVVGVSFLSGEHLSLTPKILEALRDRGLGHLPLLVGGVLPAEDEEPLLAMGVRRVFRGSLVRDVVRYLESEFGLRLGPESARREDPEGERKGAC